MLRSRHGGPPRARDGRSGPRRLAGRRFRIACLAAGAAVMAAVALAPAAHASTGIGRYTDNLPSMTEAGGAEYMAYADQTAAGQVHVLLLNSSFGVNASWFYSASSTFVGTGPSIASVNGQAVVVAWTDGNTGDIQIAYLADSGFVCVTDLKNWLQDTSTGTPAGVSNATPYLSTEGANGTGTLFLTWVDAASGHLHISQILTPNASNCGYNLGFQVQTGVTVNDTSDTSWDGPAFVTSGYNGTTGGSGEKFWLMWAGTSSGHHMNIAEYTPTYGAFGFTLVRASKVTQGSYATLTDAGGAYNPSTGEVWLTYCGTNNVAYYQEFSPGNVSGSTQNSTGESCAITNYTTGGITYYSGGVGASYDYSHNYTVLSWPTRSSSQIQVEVH